MKKILLTGTIALSLFLLVSCADGFLKPHPDHDERLIGAWSNYSIDTMEGDIYFFYSDYKFTHKTYNGWKDKENFEFYNPTIKEGIWSTKENKLRLSTELFDKTYDIIMKDTNEKYLLLDKNEYLKI